MASIKGTSLSDIIRPGQVSAGVTGAPSIYGDVIEGLAGNDTIDGGEGYDQLLGGADADSLVGGYGSDTLDGGTGADTLVGGSGRDLLLGGEGNDVLDLGFAEFPDRVERAEGGAGNDLLIGHQTAIKGGIVMLQGGDGIDTIRGFGLLDNVADYSDRTTFGINATLGAAGTAKWGTETDVLEQVVRIRATAQNDTLKGSAANETFLAGRGQDSINGGTGQDWLDYSDDAVGVNANIATGTAIDGGGATDIFSGIENLAGSLGADTLTGDAKVNEFRGLAGNDLIDGGGGWDAARYDIGGILDGPQGMIAKGIVGSLQTNTVIDSWGGQDKLVSIEELAGSELADDITGRSGGQNNHIKGLGGNDTLRAPEADTRVLADYRESPAGIEINLSATQQTSAMGNVLAASTGRDGHGFVDTFDKIQGIIGSNQADWIRGGDQPWEYGDRLLGWAGNDTILGGTGDDTVFGGQGVDVLVGGKGMDFIAFAPYANSEGVQTQGAVASLLTGVIANDGWGNVEYLGADNEFEVLLGTAFGDVFEGKKIDDAGVIAEQMECQLRGGEGADTLRAAQGDERWVSADYMTDEDKNGDGFGVTVDLLAQIATDGWGFQDLLQNIGGTRGSAFRDLLTGNAGDNWFRGEAGNDTILGGDGIDLASFFSSTSGAVVDLAAGTAQDGYGFTDQLSSVENVVGAKAAGDKLDGSAVANRMSGFGGNDRIDGREGQDTLLGGMGADTLIGGTGADKLTGGEAADRFLWRNAAEGGDVVTDFAGGVGGDRLVFERAGFDPGLSTGALAAGRFVAGADAHATAAFGQFLYDTGTGALRWDADGTGAGQAQLVATLEGLPMLAASDIFLI
jgi:Ca2+-binding RTX toxin-like protein